jgi:hypothetical protein
MFRMLFILILVALGLGLWFTDPNEWKWADRGGPYVVNALQFLGDLKPFSFIVLFAVAGALFLTRKQY